MKATIEFDEQLYRRLKIEAARRGRTVRDMVSDAVRQVLDGPTATTGGSPGSPDGQWAPTWLGSLAQYAHNGQDHSMESVRKSIARGRTGEDEQ